MVSLIGHLHSLFVHLPIGCWFLFLLYEFFIDAKKYAWSIPIAKRILLFGIVVAFLSMISGYIQSKNQSYSNDHIFLHQWIAYGTTLLFIGYYYWIDEVHLHKSMRRILSLVLMMSILCTLHFGSTLTHGENYINIQQSNQSADQFSNGKERPDIDPVEPNTLKTLNDIGWVVIPIDKNSNYYRVSVYHLKDSISNALMELIKISPNVVELKLSHTNMKNVEYLNLYGTNISDQEIMKLKFGKNTWIVYPNAKDTLLFAPTDTLIKR